MMLREVLTRNGGKGMYRSQKEVHNFSARNAGTARWEVSLTHIQPGRRKTATQPGCTVNCDWGFEGISTNSLSICLHAAWQGTDTDTPWTVIQKLWGKHNTFRQLLIQKPTSLKLSDVHWCLLFFSYLEVANSPPTNKSNTSWLLILQCCPSKAGY